MLFSDVFSIILGWSNGGKTNILCGFGVLNIYIYMLDVAGFTVVMAILELADAIYSRQKTDFNIN